ncbi:MAG: O-antigen ligase family protein [Nitrospirales bacterium]|nr:O-antigen ligase family protein [Nitrospira sp.]MDR4502052.1 O-antigen ligase family protein [Nitrospirales bacterium]
MEETSTVPFRSQHFAWLLLYLNLLMLFPRSGQSVTSLDPQSAFRILMVMLAGTIAILSLPGNGMAIRALVKLPLATFFFFAIIALFSSTFASLYFYSMWKGLEILADVLVIAVIIGHQRPFASIRKTYNLTLLLIGLTAATAWIGVLVNPGYAFVSEKGLVPFRLQGYYPRLNSNSLGSFSAISALVALMRLFNCTRRRGFYAVIAVAMALTMILTTSRTALIAFVFGLLNFFFFSRRKALFFTLLGGISLILIGGIVQEFARDWFRKGQADSTLESLSGRTVGWKAAWELFKESPFWGNGFASAGRFDVLNDGASTLHGSFFEIIVGVGLVGCMLWGFSLFYTGVRIFRPQNVLVKNLPTAILHCRSEVLSLYAFLLVRGLTSSGLASHEKEFMLMLTLAAFATINLGVQEQTAENPTGIIQESMEEADGPSDMPEPRYKYKYLE